MYCLSIGPFYEITCSFSSTFMCPNDSSRNHLWTFSLFLWFYVRKWLSWELSLDFSCSFFAFMSKAAPYSCNSRGRPSGSWKKVNFLLENSSIRTGSQRMSMASSSAFTCSTESTRNARWRSPAASGRVTLFGGFFAPKISSSTIASPSPICRSSFQSSLSGR